MEQQYFDDEKFFEEYNETQLVVEFLRAISDLVEKRGVEPGSSKINFNQDYLNRSKLTVEFKQIETDEDRESSEKR